MFYEREIALYNRLHKRHKKIVYKKTDERYIEWQRARTSGTKSENGWQWMTTSGQQMTSSVTTSGTTSDNEWQRVTTNGNEW